jgi:1-acyl-sn-glycerol-3-phosphate acyltransferase
LTEFERVGRWAVFPEGTRSSDGCLQEFKSGAFKIAIKAGVPIVPVAIRGAFELLRKGSLAPVPGSIDVVIGEPIETTDYHDSVTALIERTKRAIQLGLSGVGLDAA